jgi:hypothetical protein
MSLRPEAIHHNLFHLSSATKFNDFSLLPEQTVGTVGASCWLVQGGGGVMLDVGYLGFKR